MSALRDEISKGIHHPEYDSGRGIEPPMILSSLLISPSPVGCPLMKDFQIRSDDICAQSCKNCDSPLARSFLPADLSGEGKCAVDGQCVLRLLGKIEGKSLVTIAAYCRTYMIPFPVDEFNILVANYRLTQQKQSS